MYASDSKTDIAGSFGNWRALLAHLSSTLTVMLFQLAIRVVILASLVVILAACTSPIYRDGAMQAGNQPYPGEFVDVGDHKLFVSCSGSGPYRVVFETGGGGVHLLNIRVQRLLAVEPSIQVCSYDRAGHGWSEPASGPYDMEKELETLHRVLEMRHIRKNIILAGASYGGFMIRSFAAKYPAGIIGLVYVDPNTLYFFDKHPEIVQELEASRVPFLVKIAPRWLVRRFARNQVGQWLQHVDEDDARTIIAMSTTRKHLSAAARYARGFPRSLEIVRQSRPPSDIPIVVISRGLRDTHAPWTTIEREADWRKGHRTLLEGVDDSQLVVADQSGHEVPLAQPEIVADAIRTLVRKAKRRSSPP